MGQHVHLFRVFWVIRFLFSTPVWFPFAYPIHPQLTIISWLQIPIHLDWMLSKNYFQKFPCLQFSVMYLTRTSVFLSGSSWLAEWMQLLFQWTFRVILYFSRGYYTIWSTWTSPYQAIQTMCQKGLISSACCTSAEGDWLNSANLWRP